MNNIDKAIEILRATNGGNALAQPHLYLVQIAVNGHLSDEGEKVFSKLHADVTAGTYVRPWFHGIEHLTQDTSGYVYWRMQRVEHYSFTNAEDERKSAERLADACRRIEARGGRVGGWCDISAELDAIHG